MARNVLCHASRFDKLERLSEFLNLLLALCEVTCTNRDDLAVSSNVFLGDVKEFYCPGIVVDNGDNVHHVQVATCDFNLRIHDRLEEGTLELRDLVLEQATCRSSKLLDFVSSLLARRADTHCLLRCACVLLHLLFFALNLEVSIKNVGVRSKVTDGTLACFGNDVRLLRATFFLYDLNLALDNKVREDHFVEGVCSGILQMVDVILHPHQIIERPHCPKIVRAFTPACVVQVRASRPRLYGLFTDNEFTIHHRNNVVLEKGLAFNVVNVSVEIQDFDIARSHVRID